MLREQFDVFANFMYCFSNLIPVPIGYNGSTGKIGKGTYEDNNDYPYFYYCSLQKRKAPMLDWVDKNLVKYHLRGFYEL